jgi:hypothetical protein
VSTRRAEGADGLGEDTRPVVVEGLDERPMPAVEPLATDGLADRDDDEPAADARPAPRIVCEAGVTRERAPRS